MLLVTNRSRCPSARSRAIASTAPGIGSPETWRTPSTSSRMAAMPGESIRVTRSVALPVSRDRAALLALQRPGRPAREHVRDARGGALRRRGLLGALRRRRSGASLAKAGPTLRAIAQDERSQLRNRELAIERLVEQLRQALKVERRRVATKPTKASRERRLERRSGARRRRSSAGRRGTSAGRRTASRRCCRRTEHRVGTGRGRARRRAATSARRRHLSGRGIDAPEPGHCGKAAPVGCRSPRRHPERVAAATTSMPPAPISIVA